MLPFKPLTAASSSVFSLSVMFPRMSTAFSAPLGYSASASTGSSWRIGTYTKLNGDGEEVSAGLGSNLLATGNTGQVDVARLNETLLALDGL